MNIKIRVEISEADRQKLGLSRAGAAVLDIDERTVVSGVENLEQYTHAEQAELIHAAASLLGQLIFEEKLQERIAHVFHLFANGPPSGSPTAQA